MCSHSRTRTLLIFARDSISLIPCHGIVLFHRWVEYSFSASLMALVFSVAGGINHVYMLTCIFFLIFCTMMFGLFTETLCPPNDLGNDKKPLYWLRNDTNPHALWWPVLNGRIHRLMPHVAGYVPYIACWTIILHSFLYNVGNAEDGQGPPGRQRLPAEPDPSHTPVYSWHFCI